MENALKAENPQICWFDDDQRVHVVQTKHSINNLAKNMKNLIVFRQINSKLL